MQNIKNANKGFTMIELIVTIGVIVIFCGFSIISIAVIPQTRMKQFAESIKSNFVLSRDLSKSHGGSISFKIKKTDAGLEIIKDAQRKEGQTDLIKSETTSLKDAKVQLYYKITGIDEEYQLGVNDHDSVSNNNGIIEIRFSQTKGAVIGPCFVDEITISNGSKNYKLVIIQSSGSICFDYELKEGISEINQPPDTNVILIENPTFILDGQPTSNALTFDQVTTENGTPVTIQPEISYDSRYLKISGVYRAANPGTYTIYFEIQDPTSARWRDSATDGSGNSITKSLTWSIAG